MATAPSHNPRHDAAGKAPAPAPARRSGLAGALGPWLALSVVLAVIMVLAPGTLAILLVGMAPSVVVLVTDTTPARVASRCVSAMNLAGVAPVIASAWSQGGTLRASVNLLSDPYNWLPMLLGAGCGWALVWAGPIVAGRIMGLLVDRDMRRLRKQEADLVSEWGRKILDEDR